MKITSINIIGYGKLKDKAIDFTDGLNVIYGKNEAGKTTTHSFIKSMLFGMKKKKSVRDEDTYSKYFPVNKSTPYEGYLTFNYKNKEYQVHRIFNDKKTLLEIREIKNGKLIEKPELLLNKALYNLNFDSFSNTISIGQMKSAQDSTLIKDLKAYIANLNTSGSMHIDSMAAINSLRLQKENLSLNLKQDAAILYNRNLSDVKNIEKELSDKTLENHLPDLLGKKSIAKDKLEKNNEEIDNLKKKNAESVVILEECGFTSKKDAEYLSSEMEKYFLEFAPFLNSKLIYKTIAYILATAVGIASVIFSLLFMAVSYPDVATFFNVKNIHYSLSGIANFVIKLPFHPIILIALLMCVGVILIIGGVLLLVFNILSYEKFKNIKSIISDVFSKQIGDPEITSKNMLKFRKHMKNMKELSSKLKSNDTMIEKLTKENNELYEKIAKYDIDIRNEQKNQFSVEKKYTELSELRNESEKIKRDVEINDNINKDIDSIDLAIETIDSLANDIKVSFGMHLNRKASSYIYALTNGKYNSLNVDNQLNVTINYEGNVIPLEKISTGTVDQVYLALRLASAELIKGTKESLPLLFDDCFAMYDNERLESTLKYLDGNFDSQKLIFTCHTREAAYLSHNNIEYKKITI